MQPSTSRPAINLAFLDTLVEDHLQLGSGDSQVSHNHLLISGSSTSAGPWTHQKGLACS